MKTKIEQIKEKIAGFIFDLIMEYGSKSKFFRKYTNHRFRKQYHNLLDTYYGSCSFRRELRKEIAKLEKENKSLYKRLESIYDRVKVVATEIPKNAPCPHGEQEEDNGDFVRTDSIKCWCCPGFVCRIPEHGTIICWNENFEQSEDLEKKEAPVPCDSIAGQE